MHGLSSPFRCLCSVHGCATCHVKTERNTLLKQQNYYNYHININGIPLTSRTGSATALAMEHSVHAIIDRFARAHFSEQTLVNRVMSELMNDALMFI